LVLFYQPSKFACLQGKICDRRKGLKPRPLGRNIAKGDGVQGLPWGFNPLYFFNLDRINF